jgi:hypothetical protein
MKRYASLLVFSLIVLAAGCGKTCGTGNVPPNNPTDASADAAVPTASSGKDTLTLRPTHPKGGHHPTGGGHAVGDTTLKMSPTGGVTCANPTRIGANGVGTSKPLGGTFYGEVVKLKMPTDNPVGPAPFQTCTGVILNSRVVLTAGHCTQGEAAPPPPNNGFDFLGHPTQYQAQSFTKAGAATTPFSPAVPVPGGVVQITHDSSAITLDGTGFASAAYDPTFGAGPAAPFGVCSGNPNLYCSHHLPDGIFPPFLGFEQAASSFCTPGTTDNGNPISTYSCCDDVGAGTCNPLIDIGVIIFPPNTFPQFPCVSVATLNQNGSAMMITGRSDASSPDGTNPLGCTIGASVLTTNGCNNQGGSTATPPIVQPQGACLPPTTSCSPDLFGCYGGYSLNAWATDYPPIDFAPFPIVPAAKRLQNYCDTFSMLGYLSNDYQFCSPVVQGGDSGGPEFVLGTHTVGGVNVAVSSFDIGTGTFEGTMTGTRVINAVDSAAGGGNWVQNIVNKFGGTAGCYREP